MPYYTDLEKCKKSCSAYVKTKAVVNSLEKSYHVIRANQTMNPEYQKLDDNNFMICSDTYIKQLNQYIKEEGKEELVILHTSIVEK